MPVYPIPNDWNGTDWECFIIEWPFSEQWVGILRGFVTTPLRGRFWDGKTGSIIDAQDIGREIEERNPVTTCDAMVVELQRIAAAIENIDANSDTQVTIQTNIVNEVTAVADAIAVAGALSLAASQSISTALAWSNAVAASFASVEVTNNVTMQMRPLQPGTEPPPETQEEGPTGISATAANMSDAEVCKRAFWIAYTSWKIFQYIATVDQWIFSTTLSAVGVLGDALAMAAILVTGGTKAVIVPASVLVQVGHLITKLQEDNLLTETFDALESYYSDVDRVACEIADRTGLGDSTDSILDFILNDIISQEGVTAEQAGVARLTFNLNTLAGLYYVSPILDVLPAVLPGFDDTCETCLE